MTPDAPSLIDRIVDFDQRRPSLPGEHWLTFALGLVVLSRPCRTTAGRLVALLAGLGLLARSVTGRDGAIAALERRSPRADDDDSFIEVAAVWPYDTRVRVSRPRRTRR